MPRLRVYQKPPDRRTKENKETWDTFEELIEQHASMKSEIHALKKEIFQLNYEKRRQKEEIDVVNWYIQVMEDGKTTKELWHELVQKRKDVETLEEKLKVIEDEYKLKVATIREKLKKTKIQLTKQNKEVVKPMVEQMKLSHESMLRYQTQYEKNFENLKIMHAVLRLPRMSDQLYKTMKRKEQDQVHANRRKEAVRILGTYVNENNENEFYSKFLDHIDQ